MLLDAVTLSIVRQWITDDLKNYATIDQGEKADTALQENDITSGRNNGTIAIRKKDIQITGLQSAAYCNSSDFDTSGSAVNALENAKDYVDGKMSEVNKAVTNCQAQAKAASDAANRATEASNNLENNLSAKTINFDSSESIENISSGESFSVIFGKIKNWFSSILSDEITQDQVDQLFK